MPYIEWTDERFGVGVSQIDNQHKYLVRLLNEMHDAIQSDDPRVTTRTILPRLASYTQFHFRTEELLMKQHAYPGAAAHMVEHERLIARVDELIDRRRRGDTDVPARTMQLLIDWLQQHILHMDRELGRYLQDQGLSEEQIHGSGPADSTNQQA
jgi:hemerythrin